MREYTVTSLGALLLALTFVAVCDLWRDPALCLGLLVFAAMTVAADVALTAIGIYGYDRRFNAGVYLGRMPLEDLAYGVALYLTAVTAYRGRGAPDG